MDRETFLNTLFAPERMAYAAKIYAVLAKKSQGADPVRFAANRKNPVDEAWFTQFGSIMRAAFVATEETIRRRQDSSAEQEEAAQGKQYFESEFRVLVTRLTHPTAEHIGITTPVRKPDSKVLLTKDGQKLTTTARPINIADLANGRCTCVILTEVHNLPSNLLLQTVREKGLTLQAILHIRCPIHQDDFDCLRELRADIVILRGDCSAQEIPIRRRFMALFEEFEGRRVAINNTLHYVWIRRETPTSAA